MGPAYLSGALTSAPPQCADGEDLSPNAPGRSPGARAPGRVQRCPPTTPSFPPTGSSGASTRRARRRGRRSSRDGHLVGASDLVRQAGCHYAAFPPFGGTVDDFRTRRDEAGLSDGECLTLAVSGLRGLAEAGFLPEGPRG